MITYSNHSDYFARAFGNLAEIVGDAARVLRAVEYDTMIGTGLSGTLVVPTLARELNKHWAIVRKESSPHTSIMVEGNVGERWMFVDDFVSSGRTQRRVRDAVAPVAPRALWVGTLTYEPGVTYTPAPSEAVLPPRRPYVETDCLCNFCQARSY